VERNHQGWQVGETDPRLQGPQLWGQSDPGGGRLIKSSQGIKKGKKGKKMRSVGGGTTEKDQSKLRDAVPE